MQNMVIIDVQTAAYINVIAPDSVSGTKGKSEQGSNMQKWA